MIIGIDDTDSKEGMCTTYLCAVLVEKLKKYGEVLIPRLVRLNPCIPFKTRGNGAVSFLVLVSTESEKEVREKVVEGVEEMSELREEETNPGVVFFSKETLAAIGEKELLLLKNFYENAVRRVLKIEESYDVISKLRLDYFGLKNKRGLIGALAAAAFLTLQESNSNYDFTYELIAYRERERCGTLRFIEEESVWKSDEATYPLTWDTVDVANKEIVFVPHSPCPVLFGIRGSNIGAIYKAHEMIRAEPVEREMLFITNQSTDFHLIKPTKKENLEDYCSYILDGVVSCNPFVIEGGHVVFSICEEISEKGKSIDCVAYEPTKDFRTVIKKLRVGDKITVYGSLRKNTINLEKIEIKELSVKKRNPKCRICGRTMDSMGIAKGYKCKKCNIYSIEKDVEIEDRSVEEGLYEVSPAARRHISKPLIRMYTEMKGRDKKIHLSR